MSELKSPSNASPPKDSAPLSPVLRQPYLYEAMGLTDGPHDDEIDVKDTRDPGEVASYACEDGKSTTGKQNEDIYTADGPDGLADGSAIDDLNPLQNPTKTIASEAPSTPSEPAETSAASLRSTKNGGWWSRFGKGKQASSGADGNERNAAGEDFVALLHINRKLYAFIHEKDEALKEAAKKIKDYNDLRELNRTLNEMLHEVDVDARSDNKAWDNEVSDLYNNNDGLEDYNTKVAAEAAKAQAAADEAIRMQELYEGKVVRLEKKIEELEEEKQEFQERIDDNWKQMEDRDVKYAADCKKLGDKIDELSLHLGKLDGVEEEREELKREIKQLEGLHLNIEILQRKNKEFGDMETELKRLQVQLEDKNIELQTQACGLTSEKEIEWKKQELRKQLESELQGKCDKVAKKLEAENAELKMTLAMKDEKLGDCQSAIHDVNYMRAEIADQAKQLRAMSEKLDKADSYAIELSKELEGSRQAADESIELNTQQIVEIDELSSHNADMEAAIKAQATRLQAQQTTIVELQANLAAVKNEKDLLEQGLTNFNNSAGTFTQEIQAQVDQLTAELETEREQRGILSDSFKQQIADLEAQKVSQTVELASLKEKLKNPLTAASNEARKQIVAKDKQIEQLLAKNAELEKKVKELPQNVSSAPVRGPAPLRPKNSSTSKRLSLAQGSK